MRPVHALLLAVLTLPLFQAATAPASAQTPRERMRHRLEQRSAQDDGEHRMAKVPDGARVERNIAYGTEQPVSMDRIVAAAKAANAHKFIEKMPEGYKTQIGSRGSRLSGGERQRIAIARAILKNAPILILDEATSSLDSETEALIQDALNNMMKGRTVFVIAHRLSTIQNCDVIYVVEGGRFVEHGSHEELLALNGRYARFYSIQFGRNMTETV